jgi:hypothetical protein
MELIDTTRILVKELYRNGNTNNENLQKLLWSIKELTELSEEQLKEAEIKCDLETFLMLFITELANLYKPTNSSQYVSEVNNLYNSTILISEKTRVKIKELQDVVTRKIETYESGLIKAIGQSSSHPNLSELNNIKIEIIEKCAEIENHISNEHIAINETLTKWLRDCRY